MMSYIVRYFQDALIPIMTAVTFEENLTKLMELIFYVPTMSQYILSVVVADNYIFHTKYCEEWKCAVE